jgi:anti-anti-sigma factor
MEAFTIVRNGGQCLVTPQGNLTALHVPAMQARLKSEIENGASELVLDLGNAVMLDSTGIGLLLAARNSLARTQGRVRVCNVSHDIFVLLQSMRLVERLNVTERPKEAVHG